MEVLTSASSLTQSRELRWQQRARRAMANQRAGKAASEIPALKPYRGKPAVRNFRGGNGNVGIIRSPVRAIALPDNGITGQWQHAGRKSRSIPRYYSLQLAFAALALRSTRNRIAGGAGDEVKPACVTRAVAYPLSSRWPISSSYPTPTPSRQRRSTY